MDVTVSTTTSQAQAAGFGYTDRLGTRSTAKFDLTDDAGLIFYTDEQVTLSDPTLGQIFQGYVETEEMSYLPGTQTRFHTINCKDQAYLAGKRIFTKPDNGNRWAGDYMGDLVNDYLAAEGVTAAMALRHDRDATGFAQGTLAHTIIENGALVLSHDGTPFTVIETDQGDWAGGTLTNVQANADGTLTLASFQAIKFTGTCVSPPTIDAYNCRKIWSGSQVVASGDLYQYSVWVSSTSPDDTLGCNLVFSDNSTMSTIGGFVDQYSISATNSSMNGLATGTWFARIIDISAAAGKTIVGVTPTLQGDKLGNYAYYYRNIRLTDSGGTLKATFFNTSLQMNKQLGNVGYQNVFLSQVTAYEKSGERVSPGYPNTLAKSVKDSIVAWTQTLPPQVLDTQNNNPPLTVAVSLDNGGFYYPVSTNGGPIPNLAPGTDITGSTIRFDQHLTNYGPTPEYTPVLSDLTLQITSGYYQVKTDVVDRDTVQADFGTGTLSHVTNYATGLTLTGFFRNWNLGSLTNLSVFGTGTPTQTVNNSTLALTCNTAHEVRSQFSFAGNWQNFICEMDVWLAVASGTHGIVYRTTNWNNADNTFAYLAYITTSAVVLGYGVNSNTSPSWTQISSVAASLTAGVWYRMRLEISGNSHKVYIDDQLYISVTDSTYPATGNMGARFANTSGARTFGAFDNFGVVDTMSGVRTNPSLNLAAAGKVASSLIQWSAIVPDMTTLLVEASLDAGVTWQTCTNNMPIPGLTYGMALAGKSLLVRETLTTSDASNTPRLYALTSRIVGQTAGSDGTRISPGLAATGVGPLDSTSVSWVANVPAATLFHVDTSIDGGVTWTEVINSGDPIPGLLVAGPDYAASFYANLSADWVGSHYD